MKVTEDSWATSGICLRKAPSTGAVTRYPAANIPSGPSISSSLAGSSVISPSIRHV